MSNNRSSIDEMRKKLYMRGKQNLGKKRRSQLRPIEYGTKSTWNDQAEIASVSGKKKRRSFLSTLLTVSITFFFIALAISAYFIFVGINVVSSDKIDIQIQGPTTIGGGEELSLQISIRNENNISMENANLLIEYPEGTRSADDISQALPRYRVPIGTILPGESIKKTVKSILLGPENSGQNIKVIVEYRIEDSGAILFTERDYDIKLISAPLSILVSSLDEITSGQVADFTVTVTSNSNTIIKDALLTAEYPFGFKFISAEPDTAFSDKVWVLGDIQPETKKIIKLRGIVVGENQEERVFRFSTGVRSQKNEKELGVAFATSVESIFIKKPFVGVDLAINGDSSSEYVTSIGDGVRADITWTNNMPVRVEDLEIDVKLAGSPLDRRSVSVGGGFYRSIDDTILFNSQTDQKLLFLNPGESGRASFSFSSLGISSGSIFNNPEITLDVSVRGKRVTEGQVPQEINSSLTRTIKFTSDLLLTTRSVYFTGPFTNTGPLPPKAETETTYTVIWTVANSSNIVDNTTVTAILPSYVRWTGITSPVTENISFNEVGGKVTWDIGSIQPKSDPSNSGQREVAFQVVLLPSVSQIGSNPNIVNTQTMVGVDRFTGEKLSSVKRDLTTWLFTDPQFSIEFAKIVE